MTGVKTSRYTAVYVFLAVLSAVLLAAAVLTIQSSIVVSLGMVGALSIVRFRTAIKDPMDLMFLFWSISVGIICGAGLSYIAAVLSLVLTAGILLLNKLPLVRAPMILVVNASDLSLEKEISDTVRAGASYVTVKSHSMRSDALDLVYELRVTDGGELVRRVAAIPGVASVSLMSHDGEVCCYGN